MVEKSLRSCDLEQFFLSSEVEAELKSFEVQPSWHQYRRNVANRTHKTEGKHKSGCRREQQTDQTNAQGVKEIISQWTRSCKRQR